MHHAWCVDKHGVVIDPTWRDGNDYFGIPFDQSFAVNHMLSTKSWGILGEMVPRKVRENHPKNFIHKDWIDNELCDVWVNLSQLV